MTRLLSEVSQEESSLDADLMQRWRAGADPAAMDQLVRRHGQMVLGVCRRVLRDPVDVEDAFQATFLVFVRRGRSLERPERVAGWLHGVAVRVACKARADRARRRQRETIMLDPPAPQPPEDTSDLRRILDEELDRLPAKYRLPIVLCELDGRTLDGAAKILGWPKGTVAGRLSRGRDALRRRLSARRGLALPFFLFGWAGASAAQAAPSEPLVSSTIAAASGRGAPQARPAALADAVLRDRPWRRARFAFLFAAITAGSLLAWEVQAAVRYYGPTSPSNAPAALTGGCHSNP
jgi:RNA polymerase sigma factor (sigma-70 family)